VKLIKPPATQVWLGVCLWCLLRTSARRKSMKQDPRDLDLGVGATFAAFLLAVGLAVAPAAAQQTPGEPGSPSGPTTIDGKQIPPPPKFGGVTKQSAAESKPWWPPRVVPPKGAPNVLLILNRISSKGSVRGMNAGRPR
jgi:hypothetical protein